MTKKWLKAAAIRAVRTFAEAMLAYIGTGAVVLGDVNWLAALSAGAFGFIVAILFALAGLPEVDDDPEQPEEEPKAAEPEQLEHTIEAEDVE